MSFVEAPALLRATAFTQSKSEMRTSTRETRLYHAIGVVESRVDELAMLWILNLSDGTHSLLDIAERSGCAFDTVKKIC